MSNPISANSKSISEEEEEDINKDVMLKKCNNGFLRGRRRRPKKALTKHSSLFQHICRVQCNLKLKEKSFKNGGKSHERIKNCDA